MKLGNKDKTKLTKRIIICKYDFIAYLSIKYATINANMIHKEAQVGGNYWL